ncbi:MAG: Fe-S protein assembly chaperone HscA [Candidatus Cloacimonetes bacterium]|nr:Fe-S protein assembly chaperone HscA [Candidatus Cloacimonadota bacterium]
MSVIVGIDLGTTNSLVSICQDGVPVVLTDKEGNGMLPSVVTYTKDSVLVGNEAKKQFLEYPDRTIYSVKRLFGKSYSDIKNSSIGLPFQIGGDNSKLSIRAGDKELQPFEVSAQVLAKLKSIAEKALGKPVEKAVITVPAWFDDTQRNETRYAARLANLEVVRILNEPTAAALAYGLDTKQTGKIAVYDLGGGTFDVSILDLCDGVFQVLSTNGDTALGGDDMDQALVDWMIKKAGPDLILDAESRIAMKFAAEQIKIRLSDKDEVEVKLDFAAKNLNLQTVLGREEFETLINPLIQRTLTSCQRALRDSGLELSDITSVVLVGGATRVPAIRKAVKEFFGKSPFTGINPDEVVALGAAVQALVLAGGRRDVLLLDVIPLSLGIETLGGAVTKILLRNTTIPVSATEEFTTSVDNQTAITVHVLQGERELVEDCRSLSRFKVKDLPPMPAGLPRLQVSFTVDENGVLSVKAVETRSSQSASVEIFPSIGLSMEAVDKIVEESIDHAMDDFELRMLVELRNKAERIIVATDRVWQKAQSLMGKEEMTDLEKTLNETKAALKRGEKDKELMQNLVDRLGDLTRPLADKIFTSATEDVLVGKSVAEI